ncbi:uncharacterized protein [Ptychodera flava]|uniref:uncharacterized protein n=1 Tax=Ptychodera flava TaxID=63121 RepID=UPI00396A2CC4
MHKRELLVTLWLLVTTFHQSGGVSIRNAQPAQNLTASKKDIWCESDVGKQLCVCMGTPGRVCDRGTEFRTLQVGLLDRYMEEFPKSSYCSCDRSYTENSTEFFMNLVFVSKVPWEEVELHAKWDAIEVLVEHTRISLPDIETSTCENHLVIVALMESQLVHISNRSGDCTKLSADELEAILKVNRTEYILSDQYCSGLRSLMSIMNGTLSSESLGRRSAYWVIVALILIFITCWIVYTQISFWCIQRRDRKTSWEYWTSTYVCFSTITGLIAFGVVTYYLLVTPLLFEEDCENNNFGSLVKTNW